MSENGGARNLKPLEGVLDEFGLGNRRPHHVARAIAVAEAGTVENDDTVISGGQIDQTAGFKILDHAAIAVKKNQRFARAPLDVVEPNAVDVEETAGGRIVTLRFLRKMAIDQRHRDQRSNSDRRRHDEGRRLCVAASDWEDGTQASNRAG